MILGLLFAVWFGSFVAWNAIQHSKTTPVPSLPSLLVPLQVGKQRDIGGGNRDASMFTQSRRRIATVNGHYASGRTMKESTHTTGFSTGVVEVFSIGSICTRICASVVETCSLILDGGFADTEVCVELDGGDAGTDVANYVDGGFAETEICD